MKHDMNKGFGAAVAAGLLAAGALVAGDAGAGGSDPVDAARAKVSQMALRSERIYKLLRDARQARDGRSAPCLDDKLSQSHATERSGEEEAAAIERAAREGDGHAVAWRSQRLEVLAKHSAEVYEQAKHCGKRA